MGFVSKRDDELDEEIELIDSDETAEEQEDCGCSVDSQGACGCSLDSNDEDEDDEDDEDDYEGDDEGDEEEESSSPSKAAMIGFVACLIVALLVGFFAGRGGLFLGGSSAVITESQLDDVIATYTYKGKKHKVTSREALESMYSIDAFSDGSGNYPHPSLEMVSTYIRNQILLEYARDAGIEATEEEISAYAMEILGTDDLTAIASAYQLTEEQAYKTLEEAVILQELYASVVPEFDGKPPVAPNEPKEGEEEVPTAAYAEYIIGLLGDNWDAESDTWANTDNDFYTAMGKEDFSSKGATYKQAGMAYYVAYNQFASAQSEGQHVWYNFCNEVYADVNMSIYGLFQ